MKTGVAALVVLVAILVGGQVYSAQRDAGRAESAQRHRTEATLLQPTDTRPPAWKGSGAASQTRAEVAWTGPDGTRRTGWTTVPSGLRAGSAVGVWTDLEGRALADEPANPADAVMGGVVTGGVTLLVALLTALGVREVVRARRARRAALDIDWEWEIVAPVWSGRGR